jgi:broad specificity phosphatase PhoE
MIFLIYTDMKNRYYLLRHGESLRNTKKVASSWPETIKYPLTKKGRDQAKKAAKLLKRKKIDYIFTSDLLRTKETAGIVAKELGLKPVIDKRLREVNVGILNNRPIDDIGEFWNTDKKLSSAKYFTARFKIAPPKGENYTQLKERMSDFIKDKEKRYKGKIILIVSHQRPITFLEKVVYKYSFKDLIKIILNKQEIKTGEVRELKWN